MFSTISSRILSVRKGEKYCNSAYGSFGGGLKISSQFCVKLEISRCYHQYVRFSTISTSSFVPPLFNCPANWFRYKPSLHEKPYFLSPGISCKAQNDQVNIIFPSAFWFTKGPHFSAQKSSKQEFFSNQ